MGRIINRGRNAPMPMGQAEASLPSRIRRMDGCRTFEGIARSLALRDDKKATDVVR